MFELIILHIPVFIWFLLPFFHYRISNNTTDAIIAVGGNKIFTYSGDADYRHVDKRCLSGRIGTG